MSGSRGDELPLARLVLVMVLLSLAGSIVAGAHYILMDLPVQNSLRPPVNSACSLIPSGYCYTVAMTLCQPTSFNGPGAVSSCLADAGCCR